MFKDDERNKNLRSYILKQKITELMTDDERADFWGLPSGCRMRERAKIISPEKFRCGEYVWIGEGVMLDASGGLEIGEHTSIGLNSLIWSHSSMMTNLTLNNVIESDLIERKETTLGRGCFIGGPSVIFPGVILGEKTVVMPMSVVKDSFPEGHCIISGSPAQKTSDLSDRFIEMKVAEIKKKNKQ